MTIIQKKIEDWEKVLSSKMEKKKASPLVEGTDFRIIHSTKDLNGAPMRWVKLLTKDAFKFEGDAMGHCVGSYNPAQKGLTIISLYDSNGLPHVTLEVRGKSIEQIKGKQNGAPVDKYQKTCLEFIRQLTDKEGYEVTGDGENIGMIEYETKFYFEDSNSWKKIFKGQVVPKQQDSFEEIKTRIKRKKGIRVLSKKVIEGNVDVSGLYLTQLPDFLKDVEETEKFDCSYNRLHTLEGSGLQTVEGDFDCRNNQLKTLKGCPRIVEGHFFCRNNKLTSLEGCPQTIGEYFFADHNELKTLKGCPAIIEGDFWCSENKLESLEGCPKKVTGNFICGNNAVKFTVEQVRAVCEVGGAIELD
jgi:hypothetical protein